MKNNESKRKKKKEKKQKDRKDYTPKNEVVN